MNEDTEALIGRYEDATGVYLADGLTWEWMQGLREFIRAEQKRREDFEDATGHYSGRLAGRGYLCSNVHSGTREELWQRRLRYLESLRQGN